MKVKVALWRTSPTQAVTIDPAATVGAQIGVNLLDPDGKLVPWPLVAPPGDSSLTTTDDLDEGQYHLYFTDRRAQDAVGGILADTTTIALTYSAGESITATLRDLADSGTGAALVKLTRDAKGRISGTEAATTTDLAEGDNLYFTDERAAAAAPIQSLVAGANVTIDATDPRNPIVSSTGGGGGGGGDVFGPASATNNAVALFSGTTGKLLKNGVVLGSAATTAATDYATAAQGAKADSALQDASAFATAAQGAAADTAVQPGALAAVATSGSYDDLDDKPTIPAAQVNADWNAASGVAEVLNKPTLGTASAQDAGAFATAAQGTLAEAAVRSIVAGSGVTVDATDPQHPVVSATGGGGGAVDSVNGQTGVVVLGAADVGAATTAQGATADTAIQAVVAGANVTVDNADPLRPVVSSSGGGITVHFPFFTADGLARNIALAADQMLPFFLADGSASDIALTT